MKIESVWQCTEWCLEVLTECVGLDFLTWYLAQYQDDFGIMTPHDIRGLVHVEKNLDLILFPSLFDLDAVTFIVVEWLEKIVWWCKLYGRFVNYCIVVPIFINAQRCNYNTMWGYRGSSYFDVNGW